MKEPKFGDKVRIVQQPNALISVGDTGAIYKSLHFHDANSVTDREGDYWITNVSLGGICIGKRENFEILEDE